MRHDPNLEANEVDHLECALSNAASRAKLEMSDQQWQTLCKVTKQELRARGVEVNARKYDRE